VSDRREVEQMCIENECPQCYLITADYVPGPRYDHEITHRLCLECRNHNCWTDYWEDRPLQMTPQEAIDTYDENQNRSRNEGRE